jgi:hypothetical protein
MNAWTPITTSTCITLGLATENVRGYSPLKDRTGLEFRTYPEATAAADRMNEALGITPAEAHRIVVSSMIATNTN